MELPEFQRYQLQFTAHIRHPQAVARPHRVSARRMQIYQRLVFGNLESALANCFPVCRKTLGKRLWTALVRGFLRHHQARSPLFRQIPEEFLDYLNKVHALEGIPALPGFLGSLAHYEWIELSVANADAVVDPVTIDAEGDLLQREIMLAPSLELLKYNYPVHRISPRNKPVSPLPDPVCLAVFRDGNDDVRFVEINLLVFRLLELLRRAPISGQQALEQIATEVEYVQPALLVAFGTEIFRTLKVQQLILGTRASGEPTA